MCRQLNWTTSDCPSDLFSMFHDLWPCPILPLWASTTASPVDFWLSLLLAFVVVYMWSSLCLFKWPLVHCYCPDTLIRILVMYVVLYFTELIKGNSALIFFKSNKTWSFITSYIHILTPSSSPKYLNDFNYVLGKMTTVSVVPYLSSSAPYVQCAVFVSVNIGYHGFLSVFVWGFFGWVLLLLVG